MSKTAPFGELIAARAAVGPSGSRKKLNAQWIKGARVGRMERGDAHIILLPEGIIACKTARRLPEERRHRAELINRPHGNVGDPCLSQAKLLSTLPRVRAERAE